LNDYLSAHDVPGIAEVDTRAITRHLRSRGVVKGAISSRPTNAEALVRAAREAPDLGAMDLVRQVTCATRHAWDEPSEPLWTTPSDPDEGRPRVRCVAYDFGAKRNIFRLLRATGFEVIVVPATLPAADALALRPGAVFLSNGPGDPAAATYAVEAVRGLVG